MAFLIAQQGDQHRQRPGVLGFRRVQRGRENVAVSVAEVDVAGPKGRNGLGLIELANPPEDFRRAELEIVVLFLGDFDFMEFVLDGLGPRGAGVEKRLPRFLPFFDPGGFLSVGRMDVVDSPQSGHRFRQFFGRDRGLHFVRLCAGGFVFCGGIVGTLNGGGSQNRKGKKRAKRNGYTVCGLY